MGGSLPFIVGQVRPTHNGLTNMTNNEQIIVIPRKEPVIWNNQQCVWLIRVGR